MAIAYFQPDTLAQSNPILSGLQTGQQIIGQGIQNAFLPQSLQQQLALMKAQTGLMGAQTQFFPMTAAGQYYAGLGRLMQGSYQWSPLHAISLLQNDPGFQSMVAGNPALKQQVANIMATSSTGGGVGAPGAAGGMGMPGMGVPGMGASPQIPGATNASGMPPANTAGMQTTMPMTPQQLQTLAALKQQIQNGQLNGAPLNNFSGQPNSAGGQPSSSGNGLSPTDYQNFGDALQSAANTKTIPKDPQKRIYAGSRFNTSLNNALYWLNNGADQYFGPLGQAKLGKDIAFNPTAPSLNAWRNFQSALENSNVQGALLEGVPADQISRGQYSKIFDINPFLYSSDAAKQKLNNSQLLAQSAESVNRSQLSNLTNPQRAASVEGQITPANQPVTIPGTGKSLGNGQYQLVTKSGKVRTVSDADLSYTAQQNNMSVNQIKQRLGIQ